MKRIALLALAAITFAPLGHGYYHFLRYAGKSAPWRALVEKFDVGALPVKTLTYFITDPSAVQFAPGDNQIAFVSQVRAAAKVWNSVETSDLRLAYGGITPAGASHSNPHLEVLFDEVAPGIVAQGGITLRADPNGTFVPVVRSIVRLPFELTNQKSYSEEFFGTLVHEFGHALGLQHTLISSVMSTGITRSTSKAKPLGVDDIAGLSLLYPTGDFALGTGSITGRVTMSNGNAVHLASVVAISPSGAAVSTLTHPDGTYRIDGLPPRNYYVYVHPLPPPQRGQATVADLTYPLDSEGKPIGPSGPFETVFFRGSNQSTKDPSAAFAMGVTAAGTIDNVNFAVRPIAAVGIHSVQAFGFPGDTAVKPPYLSPSMARPFLVLSGNGLIQNNAPIAGLRISVLGGSSLRLQAYSPAPSSYLQADFDVRTLAFYSDAPRHLVFSRNDDLYVLPSGFFHVDRQPPTILSSASIRAEDGSRALQVWGTNFTPDTRLLLDGVPAIIRSVDDGQSSLVVVPPPAPLGHSATIVALNSDGQSSLFLQAANPPFYIYTDEFAVSAAPKVVALPVSLVPGTESLVEFNAVENLFNTSRLDINFGTADVTVRKIWIKSPTQVFANVAIAAESAAKNVSITIASGLHTSTYTDSMAIAPASTRAFWIKGGLTNWSTSKPSVYANSIATLTVGSSPVPLSLTSTFVLIGTRQIAVSAIDGDQVTFVIPAGVPEGLASLQLQASSEKSLPIGIQIDALPPKASLASETN